MVDTMMQSSMLLGIATLISIIGTGFTRRASDRTMWAMLTIAIGTSFMLSVLITTMAVR